MTPRRFLSGELAYAFQAGKYWAAREGWILLARDDAKREIRDLCIACARNSHREYLRYLKLSLNRSTQSPETSVSGTAPARVWTEYAGTISER